jgi:hypothetical protein
MFKELITMDRDGPIHFPSIACFSLLSTFKKVRNCTLYRNVLGTRNLSEILSERESIGEAMHKSLVMT